MNRKTSTFLTQQQSEPEVRKNIYSEVRNNIYNHRIKKQTYSSVPTIDDLRAILKEGIRKMMLEKSKQRKLEKKYTEDEIAEVEIDETSNLPPQTQSSENS